MGRLGWGSGNTRPTAGLRVRMISSLHDRGIGTVVKVSSGKDNSVHAACRVKWDDGSFGVYYSGCSVSRDASARAVHPHYDSSVLEKWIEEAGWGSHGAHILATHSIRDIQSMKTAQLQALIRPGKPIDEAQSNKLHAFCRQALKVSNERKQSHPRLYCHTQGVGHDFAYGGASACGISLPLELAACTIGREKRSLRELQGALLSRTHPNTSRLIHARHTNSSNS